MPRVLIYFWRTINASGNGEKWRFSDRRDPNFAVRQLRYLQSKKVKTREKLGYPSENPTFQDGGRLPPDLDNHDLTSGILNWEIPTGKNTSDTYKSLRNAKSLFTHALPMHGSASQIRQLCCLPKFLFVGRSTSGLGTWRGLTLRVTHKMFGEIGPRQHELWISEVPYYMYESKGKWPLESDVLTLRCQRQLWKNL